VSQCPYPQTKWLRSRYWPSDWNELFLTELRGFPDRPHDDVCGAASGAMNELPQFSDGPAVSLPSGPRNAFEAAAATLPRLPGLGW
jgi:hypothetical protein